MKKNLVFIYLLLITTLCPQLSISKEVVAQSNITIVSSINPIYQIVKYIANSDDNFLLVKDNFSEHNYTVKPSDVSVINRANLIFYISDDLETYLSKILNSNQKLRSRSIQLIKGENINLINLNDRSGNTKVDPHIWLNPNNVAIIADIITKELIKINPSKKASYANNNKRFIARLNQEIKATKRKISKIKKKNYLLYHNCYAYFENYYNFQSSSIITHNEIPTIADIKRVNKVIKNNPIACIIVQPQEESNVAQKIANSNNIKLIMGDIISSSKKEGGYFKIMDDLTESFLGCFEAK